MNNVIDLLKYLATPKTIEELAGMLKLDVTRVEQLINSVETVERKLLQMNQRGNYFITRKLDWFSAQDLAIRLSHPLNYRDNHGYTVHVLPQVESTNNYALQNIANYAHKSIITTEFQSAGRGRNDKRWLQRVATDIAMSAVYWFSLPFNYQLLPLISAIAINRLLRYYGLTTLIKWPNDVLLTTKEKLAGILVESGVRGDKRYVVIGIGMNNTLGLKRDELLFYLVKYLDDVIYEYQTFGFSALKQEWLDNCVHYQQQIKVMRRSVLITSGIHIGIDDSGALLVQDRAQKITSYISADISIILPE